MSPCTKVLVTSLCAFSVSASSFAQNAPAGGSGNDIVAIVTALGPLANNLILAFSMDVSANGSAVFTSNPNQTRSNLYGGRKFLKDGDRQCVSFEEPGAHLSNFGTLEIKDSYTLATWAKFPIPGDSAAVWDGTAICPLHISGGNFACSKRQESHVFGPYDKSLTGWHHLTVTCDGNTTTLHIDGVARGTAPIAIEGRISRIGSESFPPPGTNGQCGLLDDMLFFNRALSAGEISRLMAVRLPVHEPPPQDLVVRSRPNTPAPAVAGDAPGSPASGGLIPPNPESLQTAQQLVKDYRNSLVFVTSGEGAGSGFIANMAGKPFVLTNAHVAAGVRGATFKTLQGTAIAPSGASVAVDHDIFGMQTTVPGAPLEIMRDVENNAAIGDEVVVLGNALGGGVINTIMGRIVGVGPQLVEVDAPFQPGNSGSPIIHLKTKKVVAVATYHTIRKYDAATKQPVKEPVVRRFGYRIDSVKVWQPVDWKAFAAQATEMENIEALTKAFIAFIKDYAEDGRISSGAHSHPVIRTRIEAWLSTKHPRASTKDITAANQNFLAFLKNASLSDVNAARTRLTYDYFQRQLADQQKERAEIANIFGRIIEGIGPGR